MEENEKRAHDAVLSWCRAVARKRAVGMRDGSDLGPERLAMGALVVCYLDTVGGLYLADPAAPWRPATPRAYDPKVVLASGATWTEVARKLAIEV